MDNVLIDIVHDHNSVEKNIVCCIEEMSELTKVLTKILRKSPKFSEENLLEEVSHVLLMCSVIAKTYDLNPDDIYEVQHNAIERMYADK